MKMGEKTPIFIGAAETRHAKEAAEVFFEYTLYLQYVIILGMVKVPQSVKGTLLGHFKGLSGLSPAVVRKIQTSFRCFPLILGGKTLYGN
jgi:hypothetical protein